VYFTPVDAFSKAHKASTVDVTVIKIGGSCLASHAELRKVAGRMALRIAAGEKLVLVVSALKGVTDALLREAGERGIRHPADLDAHVAKGEAESAHLLAEELCALGVRAEAVAPGKWSWPVVTDSNHGDANPLIEETAARSEAKLKPLLETGVTPVVCGFVGVDEHGRVTTLGRGGSDATALLLGRVLGATQVVLLKDVDGFYSADPKKDSTARRLPHLTAKEALVLAENGAKVIQPKALQLKAENVPLLVIGSESGVGTLITGCVET